jgi:hypothetical protein
MKKVITILSIVFISSTVFAYDYYQPEDPNMGPFGLTCHTNRYSFVSDVPGSTVSLDGGIQSEGGLTLPAHTTIEVAEMQKLLSDNHFYWTGVGDAGGGTHEVTLRQGNETVSFLVYFDTGSRPKDHLNYCRFKMP